MSLYNVHHIKFVCIPNMHMDGIVMLSGNQDFDTVNKNNQQGK